MTRAVRESQEWYLAVQALDEDFLGDAGTASARKILGSVLAGIVTAIVTGAVGYWVLNYRQDLKDEAERDELTGVLSRRALKRLLTVRLRDNQAHVVVAIIDLDDFKSVNDTYGHAVGDGVLAAMAARLDSFASRNNAIAGRLGGDEFLVIADQDLEWMELASLLAEPAHVGQQVFDVGGSVGVAESKPGQHRSAEELLRQADHALFEVKRAGGGSASVSETTAVAQNHAMAENNAVAGEG